MTKQFVSAARVLVLHDTGEVVGRGLASCMKIDLLVLSGFDDRHIVGSICVEQPLGGIRGDQPTGRAGDDVISGRDGTNLLCRSHVADVLKGGASGDTLPGQFGQDRSFAGFCADPCDGGVAAGFWRSSSRPAVGGLGFNWLNGGGGADRLIGRATTG